jgi:uncharacterized protein (TIGR03083 family)
MDKKQLLDELLSSRAQLLDSIDGLTPGQLTAPGAVEEWSVRDLLQHLSLWEAELVRFLLHLDRGRQPVGESFVADPDFDAINARWHAETKDRPLDKVIEDLHGVRRQTVRWVTEMSPEALNRKGPETWLRGRPVWKWIAEYAFEHEKEHTEQIRNIRGQLRPT